MSVYGEPVWESVVGGVRLWRAVPGVPRKDQSSGLGSGTKAAGRFHPEVAPHALGTRLSTVAGKAIGGKSRADPGHAKQARGAARVAGLSLEPAGHDDETHPSCDALW